jgi:hypothetical protein
MANAMIDHIGAPSVIAVSGPLEACPSSVIPGMHHQIAALCPVDWAWAVANIDA